MTNPERLSVWLRGDVPGVPASMQPVAHALLNVLEEVEEAIAELSVDQVWQSVGSAAPVGFHLRHLAGSTSRLFTYGRGAALTDEQRAALAIEKTATPGVAADKLVRDLRKVVDGCLAQLRQLDESQLDASRAVGRTAKSTMRGILYHAGEHAARHSGQIVTTAKIINSNERRAVE